MSAQQPEKPSRYDRSFGGLIAAMIATVVIVGGFVGVRALLREQPNIEPDKVDYLKNVQQLNDAGVDSVIYPPTLPPGWKATSVTYERGNPPTWGIGMLTDDKEFVGLVQQAADPDVLLEEYVDESPHDDGPATVPSTVGDTWETWSDDGGDHAYVLEDATTGQTVMVYGSASPEVLEAFMQTLTTDPLPPA
jgi:hypothetical protein